MKLLAAVASLAIVGVALADSPAPANWQGRYQGTSSQNWGAADPANPNSFECFQDGFTASRPVSVNITQFGFATSGLPATTVQAGATQYSLAAVPARTYTWAALNNNILMLRNAQNQIQCFYATQSGSGTSKQITIVTLGGAVYTNNFLLQCDPASYQSIPNFLTQPYCAPTPGTVNPANSTILLRANYVGGAPSPSPAVGNNTNGVEEHSGGLLAAALSALAASGIAILL